MKNIIELVNNGDVKYFIDVLSLLPNTITILLVDSRVNCGNDFSINQMVCRNRSGKIDQVLEAIK